MFRPKHMSPEELEHGYELTHQVWSPLVDWTRRRHLAFRERLERDTTASEIEGRDGERLTASPPTLGVSARRSLSVVSASV